MSNEPGTLIVYSGPSGVGKGTVLKPYLESHPNAVLSVSVTTRKPRPGETNGVEYYFISREEFDALVENNGLLEHACYSGNYYGTPRAAVEKLISEGRDVILEIEVQGAMKIKESFPDAVFIFIMPPSFEVLQKRLAGRATETEEAMALRLQTACHEITYAGRYDYIIVNENAENAREKLSSIITAAKCQTKRMKKFIDKVSECHEYA